MACDVCVFPAVTKICAAAVVGGGVLHVCYNAWTSDGGLKLLLCLAGENVGLITL